MLYFALKILIAISVALVLLYLARKWLRANGGKERFVRSLPSPMVQEIADRLGEEGAVEQYLEGFFHTPYCMERILIRTGEEFNTHMDSLQVPVEEREDLLRVIGAIDENDLLAYALSPVPGGKVLILTFCRFSGQTEDEKGVEMYLFRSHAEV